MNADSGNEFQKQALDESGPSLGPSLVGEFWLFLKNSKKWWLLPILVILALFGLLMALSTTAVAPFIYTLF